MSKRQQKAALKRKLEALRGVNGVHRATYFEKGGDLAGWRGRSSVQKDKRKESNKRRCRQPVRQG